MHEIFYSDSTPKKIVTFGSCLSRYTANQYTYLFGGSVVSSVFHNRSDLFVKKFLGNTRDSTKIEELKKILPEMDEMQEKILKNQLIETIGLHNLSRGETFFNAINKWPDYFFIDNYIDIVGKIVRLKDNKEYFHQVTIDSKLKLGDLLELDLSIQYLNTIIKYIRSITPKTKIVFITFPGDGYPKENVRKHRFDEFCENFFSRDADMIIRARIINNKYLTTEKMHFKTAFYSSLAGLIHSNFN